MFNNSIQNIFLPNDESYGYILPLVDKICEYTGLKIVKSNTLDFSVENIFVGTKNINDVENIALKAIENNVSNAIIVSGSMFPFLTPFGNTLVAEAWKNKVFKYTIDAKSLGINEINPENILVKNNNDCTKIINEILNGSLKDAKYQTVIINAALALYISKKAKSIQDGIDLAKKIIQSNDLK